MDHFTRLVGNYTPAPDGVLADRLILLVDFWKLDHLTSKSLQRGMITVSDVFLC